MGVYNNNKDGTRSTLANTIQVVDAPMEQFISRGEFNAVTPNDVSADNKLVAENEVTKAVDTMPTASANLVGTIVQYVGTTTANYTNGYFYKCVSDGAVTPTYSWIEVISGGGSESSRYNVLNHGLKNDGTTDNTEALRNMLSEVPVGATIYFPSGTYNISDTITLSKAFNFIGEGLANEGTAISKIVYSGNTINTTMFIPDSNTFPMVSFEKLHFFGNSFTVTTNDAPFTSLPYPFLKETTILEGISCLDFGPEMVSDFRVKNCSFNGFSGFAIKGSQHKFFFTNCDFQNCNVAIKTVFDSLIQNCHFRMCGVAVEIIRNETHSVGSVNISDCWADLLSRHFMESTECSTVLNVAVSNVWVDMVDGSAFYFTGNMQSCNIQGTFGRIGMSYAGLSDADRTALIAPYSDFCYADSIRGCEFNITNGSNTIGSGENPNAECISKYLFTNVQYGISDIIFTIPSVDADKIYDRVNNVAYRLQASCHDGNVVFNVGLMFIDGVASYDGIPSSNWKNAAPSAGYFCFDTVNKRMYRSSGDTRNDWEIITDIPHYEIMPSVEDLFTLPNNTVFETDGYYSANDKCGGQYLISTSATKGSLMVNYDDKTRYLTAIDVEGTTIDVCRYGVRSSTLLTDLTVENTYATSNSDIIENLYWPYLNCIFKFPSGRFYFARPLKTIGNGVELSIFGDRNSAVIDYDRINNNAFDKGTILAFPFLTNGQTAITLGSGTIKDVTILGDFTTYDITFDRTKTISAPNEVISETIKEVDGTQVKCTGLSHGAIIENVTVAGFYTGINEPNGNIVLTNINIFHCHTGIILHFDNKVTNLFGWSVYDFMELHNNCISVTTARVDSCVHMVVTKDYCGTLTLTDIDGDWCTDSMIYLTKDGQYGAVTDSIFDGIHGRCCTLKSYDSTQSDGVDVRDLADTNGYGYVRVDDGITCKNNQFTFNSIGNLASDVTNYLTPAIAITFGNIAPSENIFKTSDTIADILKVFQTSTNYQARIDLSNGTYYINGNSVTKSSVDTTLAKNLVELSAVIDNVSHKVVKNRGEIAYRFSVADVWSNDYTVKSYTGNHSVHKRNGNSLKVVKNDNAKSSFFFVSLNQTLTGTTANTMGVWFYVPRATYDLINYFNIYSGTKNQYGQLTNQETLASIDKTSMNIGWNYFRFNNVTNDFDCLKISIADTNESTSETFDSFDLYFDSIISNYEVVPTVLLAFDNCDDASMYGYCYNEASANGLVGTFAYQGGLTPDNPSNAVTRAHLTKMQESGWDVTQYDGSPMGGGITAIENYNRTLKSEGLDMFCYFPRYNDVTTDIWNSLDEMGFKMVRSANSNPFINAVGIGTYNCYGLTFINNATVVKAKIDTAISDKKLLALIIHVPVDTDDGTSSNCLKTDYEEVISYLGEKQKNNELQVITYKELYYATILSDLNI